MNILVIDYLSYKGHRFFNRIHISTLRKLGHQICLVGKAHQFDEFQGDDNITIVQIPQNNPVLADDSVVCDIINLYWIKHTIDYKKFDKIIFLTYDILSLSFFRISKPVFVINHNNISLFSESKIGPIRLWLTKHLPKNYTHICLNELMTDRLCKLIPFGKVIHVPHGLCNSQNDETKPSFLDDSGHFVFCPINRNFDIDTLSQILNSDKVDATLRNCGIKLYIKNLLPYNGSSESIIKVENNLSKEEYDYMLQYANAVLLPYGSKFGLRCSGILFECISRNTHVISTTIDSMLCYKNMASISYYNDVDDFCNCLSDCLYKRVDNDIGMFNPEKYWSKTLTDL